MNQAGLRCYISLFYKGWKKTVQSSNGYLLECNVWKGTTDTMLRHILVHSVWPPKYGSAETKCTSWTMRGSAETKCTSWTMRGSAETKCTSWTMRGSAETKCTSWIMRGSAETKCTSWTMCGSAETKCTSWTMRGFISNSLSLSLSAHGQWMIMCPINTCSIVAAGWPNAGVKSSTWYKVYHKCIRCINSSSAGNNDDSRLCFVSHV